MPPEPQPRPNIVFVLTDQLGARWLPAYGHPQVSTPQLSSFAGQSTVFERAITTSPICTPYRGCLLSGLYPSQTGVVRNGMAYPRGLPSLADTLNEAGYATSYVGKWHLSGAPQYNRWAPPEDRAGFQDFIGWESHHVDHRRGLAWADDPDSAIALDGHETDGLTDIAIAQLEKVAKNDMPFCLLVSYQAPHPPCSPPASTMQLYEDGDLVPEPNADREAWFKHDAWNADYGVAEFRQRYFGEISQLDAAFGRLLRALDRLKLRENTLVIFTSDHGEMAGAHGLFGKGVMYEEALHVPLIVSAPGQTAGHRSQASAATIDLLPTLLDFAGCEVGADLPGRSLRSSIEGEAERHERVLISEYQNLCATTRDWKLITTDTGDELASLYNLAEDPYELDNRLRDPVCAGIVAELSGALRSWRETVNDGVSIRESEQRCLPIND